MRHNVPVQFVLYEKEAPPPCIQALGSLREITMTENAEAQASFTLEGREVHKTGTGGMRVTASTTLQLTEQGIASSRG